jgi:DNA-binding XRE family transcriptional regulator
MPAGRPSKYDPAYCEQIVGHLAEGASIASFAAEIGVARSTINQWAEDNPEFSEALKVGKAKCAAWWEERLRDIAKQGGGPGASTAVIFGLKNMAADDWRDKQEHEHSGPGGGPIKTEVSARDILAGRIAGLAERTGEG